MRIHVRERGGQETTLILPDALSKSRPAIRWFPEQ
jgi:hypothetical protein